MDIIRLLQIRLLTQLIQELMQVWPGPLPDSLGRALGQVYTFGFVSTLCSACNHSVYTVCTQWLHLLQMGFPNLDYTWITWSFLITSRTTNRKWNLSGLTMWYFNDMLVAIHNIHVSQLWTSPSPLVSCCPDKTCCSSMYRTHLWWQYISPHRGSVGLHWHQVSHSGRLLLW